MAMNDKDRGQLMKDGMTPLHVAAKAGCVDIVEMLLVHGANLDDTDQYGRTSMHYAAVMGHVDVLKMLAQRGANISAKDNKKATPLHWAALCGPSYVTKTLIDLNADPNSEDDHGQTPLHYAAMKGRSDIVQYLDTIHLDVNRKDKNGRRPIHYAIEMGHENTAITLMLCGANCQGTDEVGRTPMHYAAMKGSTIVALILFASGADVNCSTTGNVMRQMFDEDGGLNFPAYGGQTPLHYAAQNGHVAMMDLLMLRGADKNCQDMDGLQPIHYAAKEGHTEAVKFLLQQGVDIHQGDKKGRTPMSYAYDGNHKDVVQLFMDKKRKFLTTPLHIAANVGLVDLVQALLACGSSANDVNANGDTPLRVAVRNGHAEIVKVLIDNGADVNHEIDGWSLMHVAAREGHIKILDLLCVGGAAINANSNRYKMTPLHVAATVGSSDVAKLLLDNGGSLTDVNDLGLTPTLLAAQQGHANVVKVFIDKGADINQKNKDEWMPIYLAVVNGHLSVLEILIENGVDINAVCDYPLSHADDERGMTPISWAASNGHSDMVKFLIDNNANIEWMCPMKLRPAHYACLNGRSGALKHLLAAGCLIDAKDSGGRVPLDCARVAAENVDKTEIAECQQMVIAEQEARRKTEFIVVHLSSYSIVFRKFKIFDMDNAVRHIQERVIPLNRSVVIGDSAALCEHLLSSEGTVKLVSDGLWYDEYVVMGANTDRSFAELLVTQLRNWNIWFMLDGNELDWRDLTPNIEIKIENTSDSAIWGKHVLVSLNLSTEGTNITTETVTVMMMGTVSVDNMKDTLNNFVKMQLCTNLSSDIGGCNANDTLARMVLMKKQLMTFYDNQQNKIPSTQKLDESATETVRHVSVVQKCFESVHFLGMFCAKADLANMMRQEYVLARCITNERMIMVLQRSECSTAMDIAEKIASSIGNVDRLLLLSNKSIIDSNTAIADIEDVIHYVVISSYVGVSKVPGGYLGRGRYGKVTKCYILDSSKIFALKNVRNDITAEILVAAKVGGHKRILKYHRFYERDPDLYILMDCMKESLSSHLRGHHPLTQDKILKLSRGMLKGLKYLHDLKIVHRDLKGNNVLLDERDSVKLTDFGISTYLDVDTNRAEHEGANIEVGTCSYMAPEIIPNLTQNQSKSYGLKADIWSFGATMVEIVTGQPPFSGMNQVAVILKLYRTKTIDYEFPSRLDTVLQRFINCCLNANPIERPNCTMLLAHDVFLVGSVMDAICDVDVIPDSNYADKLIRPWKDRTFLV